MKLLKRIRQLGLLAKCLYQAVLLGGNVACERVDRVIQILLVRSLLFLSGLLDQAIAYGAGSVKSEHVVSMLGALDQSYLFSLLECIAVRDASKLVSEVDSLAARSISFDMTLKDLAGILSRVALAQSVGVRVADGPDETRVASLATQFAAEHVQLFYQIALLGRRDLALAPDEQSGFTMTMLRMLAFSNGDAKAVQVNAAGHKAAAPAAAYGATASPAGVAEAPLVVALTEQTATGTVSSPHIEVAPADSTDSPLRNGDWPAFVANLSLSGMAGMLAKQCEFQSFSAGVLELVVSIAQKHLTDKVYQDKLRSELMPHLGDNLRMNIRLGEATGVSLAAHEDRVRSKQQANAEAAIDRDPFIKDLRQDFGAEVVRDSIRPAGTR